ncbi:uncharacterized protein LOC141612243 [Silene latifolia]|uniref:uncharacterized protein LOC141612243 n=1 Tax=Silene latifolia TaxID=37657 RepID=UPI003D775ACE
MKDEWWLRAAISDVAIVADILLRLKDSSYPCPSPSSFLQPSWGVRQPRSKPSSSSSLPPEKNNNTDTRRSPTTPLSWSEDSSSLNFIPPPSDPIRSKISAASDTPTTSSKRPKRKKTFAELREEEASLLKERIYLNKEMATLRMTLEEQRSMNVNLKRIKLDMQTETGINLEAKPNTEEDRNTRIYQTCEGVSSSVSSQFRKEDASAHLCATPTPKGGSSHSHKPIFVLPDLNMAPDDECDQIGMS